MDPGTIALAVASLLATRAAEAAAGEAGKGAWTAVMRVADTVRSKFAGDRDATEALDRLEAKPSSHGRAQELAEIIEARLEADPEFASDLARLIEEAKGNPRLSPIVTVIQGNAQVGKVTTIGSVTGDLQF
jgi:hypothetical protein